MFYFRVVLLIVFLVLDRGLVAGAGAAPTKMIVAYASISPRVAPLWAAQEQGFFKKNGIEAELIFVRGAPTLVAALTSGDMDIGYTGGTAVLGASAAGIDLKILAVLTNRVTYDLVARPEIKRAEDLRGKRFGVTSIGGTLWMGAVLGLERLGIDTNRDDIRFMVIGDQVVLSQALEENRIDEASSVLREQVRLYPGNAQLLGMQAKAYAAQGKRLLQHQAQAEVYVLQGSLPAAIEQLQLAQSSGDGNFYELSAVEARLKEIRTRLAAETKLPK